MVNLSRMSKSLAEYRQMYILYFLFLILLDFSTVRQQFSTIRFFYNYIFFLLQLDFIFSIYFKFLYFPRVGLRVPFVSFPFGL